MPLDLEGEEEALPAAKETPESILLQRSDEQLVQRALEQLPVAYREVLLLCEVEEMSYQEISAALVIPMGTVMSRLSRARTALRGGIRHPKGSFDGKGFAMAAVGLHLFMAKTSLSLAVKHAGCATLAAGILAQSGSFFLTWFGCGTAVCGSRGRDRGRRAPATGAAHDPRFVTPAWAWPTRNQVRRNGVRALACVKSRRRA